MASAGPNVRHNAAVAFEPLFPRAVRAHAPKPAAIPLRSDPVPPDEGSIRERQAHEEGWAEGFRAGREQAADTARTDLEARIAATATELSEAIARLRDDYQSRIDAVAAESERVVLALVDKLAAPNSRPTIETLFRRYVLDTLGTGPKLGGQLLLSPETLEILQGAEPGLSSMTRENGIEIVPEGTTIFRYEQESVSGTRIIIDFDGLLAALRAALDGNVAERCRDE